MSGAQAPRKIELIPIDSVRVLNPRARNKAVFREITNNIDAVGLKKPIRVARRPNKDGGETYDLVYGQGRMEAFQVLGQTMIPAIVDDMAEADCLLISLVENCARRQHRAIDIMQEVSSLRRRGYTDSEIASKIGVTASWVNMVAGLLDKGEERLVAAVEAGVLPISLAVDIARSNDVTVQNSLIDVYAQGKIKGRRLVQIRRLVEQRARGRRSVSDSPFGRKDTKKPMTADQLFRVYRQEADRQRLLVKKADFVQSKLLFIVEALRELRHDHGFVELLLAQGLGTMPRWLATTVGAKGAGR